MSLFTARSFVIAVLLLAFAACSGSSGRADVGILDPGQRDGASEDPGSIDWGGHDGDPDVLGDDAPNTLPGDVDDATEAVGPSITCDDDGQCPFGRPYCDAVKRVCVACVIDAQCGLDRVCKAGDCADAPCTPDQKKCAGSVKKVCNHLGTGWTAQDCSPKDCFAGECQTCEAGTTRCEGNNLETCTQGGYYVFDQQCPGICYESACHTCMPGKDTCDGNTIVRCADDGETRTPVEDCNPDQTGAVCQSGKCVSLCLDNLKLNTNIGCDYWAADLDQVDDAEGTADNSPYAVVVSNANATYAAKVSITRWENGQEVPQTTDASGVPFPTDPIPPGQLRIFFLPPRNLNLTTQAPLAWHVTSTIPVIAYQFNPLENVGVFSNDASLLIPSNALGAKYTVLTWPERVGGLRCYFAVVGVGTEPATVTVTASTRTLAGSNATTGAAIPAMSAGETRQFVLAPFDVLQIESDQSTGDLTGTRIESDRPVSVFGGTQCSNVPDTRCLNGKCPFIGKTCSSDCPLTCCCDHLEEQMLPMSAWGKSYVAPMLQQRTNEGAFWRVVASEPDTHLTFDPAGPLSPVLQQGEFVEFESAADLAVTADKPVMVGQFMASSFAAAECGTCNVVLLFGSCSNGMGICTEDSDCCGDHPGDPSFILMIPNEQFRADYVFLVPNKYATDYLSVVAKAGVAVRLDTVALDSASAKPAGASGYVVYRTAIADGVHTLDADYPVMAYVYGYDTDVSYGYPAGANVVVINPAGL